VQSSSEASSASRKFTAFLATPSGCAAPPSRAFVTAASRYARAAQVGVVGASFLFEADLFGKPLHTFPDHGLVSPRRLQLPYGAALRCDLWHSLGVGPIVWLEPRRSNNMDFMRVFIITGCRDRDRRRGSRLSGLAAPEQCLNAARTRPPTCSRGSNGFCKSVVLECRAGRLPRPLYSRATWLRPDRIRAWRARTRPRVGTSTSSCMRRGFAEPRGFRAIASAAGWSGPFAVNRQPRFMN